MKIYKSFAFSYFESKTAQKVKFIPKMMASANLESKLICILQAAEAAKCIVLTYILSNPY